MKHRAQVTNHFIDCLRQAKKDRAPFLQINILGAYASALKEKDQNKLNVCIYCYVILVSIKSDAKTQAFSRKYTEHKDDFSRIEEYNHERNYKSEE